MNYFLDTPKGKALAAGKNYLPGELVQEYHYKEILSSPNKYTICLGGDKHSLGTEDTAAIYINHSCNPNTFFDI